MLTERAALDAELARSGLEGTDAGERDAVGVDGADAQRVFAQTEGAVKSCAVGPMWRIAAPCVL